MISTSFQNMAIKLARPLSFERENDSCGSTVYPFIAKANRALFRGEAKEARRVCYEMFGQGGRMPEPGNRWFGDEARGLYAFKSEADMTVFIVAMSG